MRTVLSLALRFHRASPMKFVLLSLLVAVGMTVFLVVTELSRVSSVGMDDAMAEDIGTTGSYAVDLSSDFGLSRADLSEVVGQALGAYADRPIIAVEILPATTAECPPYEQLGPQVHLVLRTVGGGDVTVPFGHNLAIDSQLCLAGQQIPATALYIPTRAEQRLWGSGFVIDPIYQDAAALATSGPITYRFVLVTGRAEDLSDAIKGAVGQALKSDMARFGVDATDVTGVVRLDTGDSIRAVSDGMKMVYAIIGWGVLALGGLGLLVAELIVVRDRTWFFGLSRAVGARRRHVAGLVLADIGLVVATGAVLAVGVVSLLRPAAATFAQEAFNVRADLLDPSSVPRLVGGVLLVLVVAGAYPVIAATRKDPLDILEPPAG